MVRRSFFTVREAEAFHLPQTAVKLEKLTNPRAPRFQAAARYVFRPLYTFNEEELESLR